MLFRRSLGHNPFPFSPKEELFANQKSRLTLSIRRVFQSRNWFLDGGRPSRVWSDLIIFCEPDLALIDIAYNNNQFQNHECKLINEQPHHHQTIDCHEIKVSKIESIRKSRGRKDQIRRGETSWMFTNILVSTQTFITRRTKHEECSEQEKRAPIGLQSGQESWSFEVT